MPVKSSKRYRSAVSAADLTKEYPLKEAVKSHIDLESRGTTGASILLP